MIDSCLSLLAPHLCCGCHKIGTLLCADCKYNIIDEGFSGCLLCGKLAGHYGLCTRCRSPYERAWCVGGRSDELKRLIDGYKFNNQYAAYRPLGDLLHARVDELPSSTIIVPIPTVSPHIRQRGYDHTLLIARYLAKKRFLCVPQSLKRVTSTHQQGASKVQRMKQAKAAFTVQRKLSANTPYLLIDDVMTTGATMQYAAEALKKHGATIVWAAVLARQPLD